MSIDLKEILHHLFGKGLVGKLIYPVVDEIYEYEKKHGAEQLKIALDAGLAQYKKSRAAGDKVGHSIIDAVAAAFESEAAEIKKISTQAMTAAIAGRVK